MDRQTTPAQIDFNADFDSNQNKGAMRQENNQQNNHENTDTADHAFQGTTTTTLQARTFAARRFSAECTNSHVLCFESMVF